ncbi:MAG: hypothetical protein KBD16_00430 [Candidatus Pacebacteria bacterium]|nr:hypothetical protein [Candidatus Paceibacterota bacterium]
MLKFDPSTYNLLWIAEEGDWRQEFFVARNVFEATLAAYAALGRGNPPAFPVILKGGEGGPAELALEEVKFYTAPRGTAWAKFGLKSEAEAIRCLEEVSSSFKQAAQWQGGNLGEMSPRDVTSALKQNVDGPHPVYFEEGDQRFDYKTSGGLQFGWFAKGGESWSSSPERWGVYVIRPARSVTSGQESTLAVACSAAGWEAILYPQ